MARRSPTKRLKRVDLPTFGLPTMATIGLVTCSPCHRAAPRRSAGFDAHFRRGLINACRTPGPGASELAVYQTLLDHRRIAQTLMARFRQFSQRSSILRQVIG